MNRNKVISTAVLLLLLGTTVPAFAQQGQEGKDEGNQKAQEAKQQPQRVQPIPSQQQPQHVQQVQQQPQRVQPIPSQQQPQRAQQAQQQPQRVLPVPSRQQPQRVQQEQQQQPLAYNNGNGNNGNHYGRIPDDRYRSNFGRDHAFRMGRPRFVSGYNRFQYGGYWFGYNERWPSGWDYNDDVYVEYVGGGYYLYNPRHPGIHISLNLF